MNTKTAHHATDDLVAIERAGITLGVEVAMPERDGRYQGDDGNV